MTQTSAVEPGEYRRYQELFDFAPEGYVLTDGSGLIEQVNHAAAALLKARRDFLLGKPLPMFVAEPGRRLVYNYLSHVAHRPNRLSDSAVEWEVQLQPPRASAVAVSLHAAVIPDEAGTPRGLRWRLRDTTHQVRAERDLHAERSLADGLIDAAQAVILVLDGDGRILRANRYVKRALGFDERELVGRRWADLLPGDGGPRAAGLLREARSLEVGIDLVAPTVTRAGPPRVVAWSGKGLDPREGGPAAVVLGHDITDLHAAQREAVQAARLAAIGEVMAGLTHESRNALQRARSCLDRFRWRLPEAPEVADLLDRATRAVVELTTMFDAVREYAAPVRLDLARCHLAEVWREAWAQAAAVASTPYPAFAEDAGGSLWLTADRAQLVRVFRNLFENAAHAAGPAGRVEVVCRDGNLGGARALRVSVRDDGPGFGASAGRAFDPFFSTKPTGTGIGLAIVRRVVEAHGGTFTAADRDGGGAELTLLFPTEQP